MTTNSEINPNGYAVVYFGDADDALTPQVCKFGASDRGTTIDGCAYAIYDTADDAAEEFKNWPSDRGEYGVLPVRMVLDERPRYVLKDSAK